MRSVEKLSSAPGRHDREPRFRRDPGQHRSGTLPVVVLLLLLLGCAAEDSPPPILDLSRVPVSDQLAAEIAATERASRTDSAENPAVRNLEEYSRLLLDVKQADKQAAASDELYRRWAEDPANPLLLELAVSQRRRLRRDDDLQASLARPALADTSTALGLFVAGRTARARNDKLRFFRAALQRQDELTPLQGAWLIRKLADAVDGSGDTASAISLLVDHLSAARSTGGCHLEMWYWQDLAGYLLDEQRLDDALHASVLAAETARCAGNDYRHQYAMSKVGRILSLRGEEEAALEIFAATAEAAEASGFQTPFALSLQGGMAIHVSRGEYDQAIDLGKRRITWDFAHADTNNAIGAIGSVGKYYYSLGEQDSSRVYMERVRALLHDYPNPRTVARMIPHLAYHHFQQGEFDVVDSLLALGQELQGESLSTGARATTLLMLVYHNLEMGRPEQVYHAIEQLEAMAPSLRDDLPDQNKLADLQLLLADFYAEQGEFILAQNALEQARARIDDDDRYQRWRYHWGKGKLSFLRDDVTTAEEEFETCLELGRDLGNADLLAESVAHLGHVYLEEGNVQAAYELLEAEATNAAAWNFKAHLAMRIHLGECLTRLEKLAEAKEHLAATADLMTREPPLRLLAAVRLRQGRVATALGDVRGAETFLREARDNLRRAGLGVPGPEAPLGESLYRHVIENLIGLYLDNPDLASGGDPALPTLLMAEECRWRASPLAEGVVEETQIRAWLAASHEPVLVFFVGRVRSFGWVLADGTISSFPLPGQRELARMLAPALAGMMTPGQPLDEVALDALGRRLLGPAMSAWRPDATLRIVADRGLFVVPWPALPVLQANETPGDTSVPAQFALQRGPVVELPSLNALVATPRARTAEPRASGALLALGVDDSGAEGDVVRLREAEAEAEEIADLWSEAGPAELRLGPNAGWRQVRALELGDFAVIHVATHAQIHQGVADRSTMRLHEGDGSEALTVTAVGELDLRANLVFLSCCEAGRRISGGGGLTDFARAFLYAGAKAVIAPSVRIDDVAARQVATSFYRHYLAGDDQATALRAALLELGQIDPRWTHPYYWAFYRLIERG